MIPTKTWKRNHWLWTGVAPKGKTKLVFFMGALGWSGITGTSFSTARFGVRVSASEINIQKK